MFEKLLKMNEEINRLYEKERQAKKILLLGNPNVGKSTVFNRLCGMHQHTGNWPGKTVEVAKGCFVHEDRCYQVLDLPGTYSLLTHSSEEEVARDAVCFQHYDVCVIVCDATCLKRDLNLVVQIMEITGKVILALNMMDEAKRKKIRIDLHRLQQELNVPVIAMNARKKQGFAELKEAIARQTQKKTESAACPIRYEPLLEDSIRKISMHLAASCHQRFLALKLLDPTTEAERFYAVIEHEEEVRPIVEEEIKKLTACGVYEAFEERLLTAIASRVQELVDRCLSYEDPSYLLQDERIDDIVCGRRWGMALMLLFLSVIFWITISGANMISERLSVFFAFLHRQLYELCITWQLHPFLRGLLLDGMLATCGRVIAVMLPPMAIFFPFFTLLEDFGYLPRIAFNLDGYFQKARTCGKQALTMAMGFGCNAVGVSSAAIIDGPRERLIAILTNTFIPCNGRFPTLIALLLMFFSGSLLAPWNSIIAALLLSALIICSILLTFLISRLLSSTILKGMPSSFSLELPSYRRPQPLKILTRSLFDRTIFVLGRALSAALPAGALLWLLANIEVQQISLLQHCASFLDPFAALMGLDGVILLAFLLGFPANEIVVPIMVMAYMANGSLSDLSELTALKQLFLDQGWTWITALCTLLFTLVHFPCATTLLTIRKQTKSRKWALLAFLIPALCGMLLCMLVNAAALFFQHICF